MAAPQSVKDVSPEERNANRGVADELDAILSDRQRQSNIERVVDVIDHWQSVWLSTAQAAPPVDEPEATRP